MRDEMSLTGIEPELGAIEAYETRDEPAFPLVLRGYDRRSVDELVEALSARVAELEALQSPSMAVKQALERVADDTGSILKEAHETADEVTRRARDVMAWRYQIAVLVAAVGFGVLALLARTVWYFPATCRSPAPSRATARTGSTGCSKR